MWWRGWSWPAAVMVCAMHGAPAAAQWQWSNPDSYGGNINDVQWAVNQYVAVGDSGVILRSNDGRQWQQTAFGERALYDIHWTGSQFIAVGLAGTILTSNNGVDWSSQISGTPQVLRSVAQNDSGLLLAVGSQGVVLSSGDGKKWTRQNADSNANLRQALWANGRFVVIGAVGDILSSSDGKTWTVARDDRFGYLRDIVWNGNQYLVISEAGYVLTSSDAVNWSVSELPLDQGDWPTAIVSHSLVTLVATGNGKILFLAPGGWQKVHDGTAQIDTVIWSQGQFVATAFDYGNGNGAILASSNGQTWSQLPASTGIYHLGRLYWNGAQYLALSHGASNIIEVSSNLSLWEISWPVNNIVGGAVEGLAWNGSDTYVVVTNRGAIYSSGDALAWTAHATDCSADANVVCWQDVIWADSLFVAVGDGARILTSADGSDWQARSPGFTPGAEDHFSAIAWHNNQFVVVGANGRIATSPDGLFWTPRASGSNLALTDIVWGNNEYLATGNDADGYGGLLRSADGQTWTAVTASFAGWLEEIAWNGQSYAAVGNGYYTSNDGVAWSKRSEQWGNSVQAIDGHFIVIDGTNISLTDDFTTWRSLLNLAYLWYPYRQFLWTGSNFLLAGSNGELQLHPGWPQFSGVPPTVSVTGGGQTVTAGDLVQLSATASDSDGEIIFAYWWSWDLPLPQWVSTPVAGSTAFVAPAVTVPTVFDLVFSANDSDGLNSYTVTRVTVNPSTAAGAPPVVNAGDDREVFSGDHVSVRGEANGEAISSYQWQVVAGPAVELQGADTLQVSFTAPTVTELTRISLRLTVTDAQAHVVTDDVVITVKPANLRATAKHHKKENKFFGALDAELLALLVLMLFARERRRLQ